MWRLINILRINCAPSWFYLQLSLENKLLVYKVILKPVWTYGVQLWGTASNSNLEILERFQSKVYE
jgi:hypothetical protein